MRIGKVEYELKLLEDETLAGIRYLSVVGKGEISEEGYFFMKIDNEILRGNILLPHYDKHSNETFFLYYVIRAKKRGSK